MEKELVDALQLLPVKAKLVLGRVAKWEPPQPLNEAQLSAKKVPGLKELWSCARSAGSRTRARRRSSSRVCWRETTPFTGACGTRTRRAAAGPPRARELLAG